MSGNSAGLGVSERRFVDCAAENQNKNTFYNLPNGKYVIAAYCRVELKGLKDVRRSSESTSVSRRGIRLRLEYE